MIRKANTNDIEFLLPLVKSCIKNMNAKRIEQWPDWYPNRQVFLTDIAQSTLYVSETNGKITGMVVLSPEIPAEYKTVLWRQNNGKVNSIHRLAVHPKLKTHGLAKKLLEFVESLAKARGYSIIRLDTYSNNPLARNFYIRNGYQYSGNIHLEFMPGLYHCFEKAI